MTLDAIWSYMAEKGLVNSLENSRVDYNPKPKPKPQESICNYLFVFSFAHWFLIM